MPEWTKERHDYTTRYIRDVFGKQDEHLAGLMAEAVREGLPDIAVSADVGHLLQLLASTTKGRLAIEVGTLAGYSTIWLARGMPQGRVVTIELVDKHARFAERQFERAGVADRVEVRRGAGLDVLAQLAAELAPGSVDLLFFDAIKREYADYWRVARSLLAPGGLLVCDNVLGAGWWIDEEGEPNRDAVDAFNRQMAADPALDVACVPLREGLLVARLRA
jgi:caffeoyl-CoA O-methyltransferase